MTDQQHQNFLAFMKRATLTGEEVPAWIEVINAVTALREKAAALPAPPAQPTGV